MDNLKYEIREDLVIKAVAKQLGIEPSQLKLALVTDEEGSSVVATVSTDLATANRIERKLKRFEQADDDQGDGQGDDPAGA